MKKVLLFLVFALFWTTPAFSQDKDIKIKVNGEDMYFQISPIIENGRVLVPVRPMVERLGGEIEYLPDSREITITKNYILVIFKLDDTEVTINDYDTYLDAPPRVLDGQAFVPLRILSDSLGYDVKWNSEDQSISIEEKSLAEQLLRQAYYNGYQKIYISDITTPPSFNVPFSFSGEDHVNVQSDEKNVKMDFHREGRLINDRFIYLTEGSGWQDGSRQKIWHEQFEDYQTNKIYRNEGNGWSRYNPDFTTVDGVNGYQHHILTFLIVNSKHVQFREEEQNGQRNYVFEMEVDADERKQVIPLVEILESNSTGFYLADFGVNGYIKIIMDAQNLLIRQLEMDLKYQGDMTGTYYANYHYKYEDITPIPDIVVENTGLEYLNDLIENEWSRSYGFTGVYNTAFSNIRVEGSYTNEGLIYMKTFIEDELYEEEYLNFATDTDKVRDAGETGWKDYEPNFYNIIFKMGDRSNIIGLLNYLMAEPTLQKISRGGKKIEIYTFKVSKNPNHFINLVDIAFGEMRGFGGPYFTGDLKGEAEFIFEVDKENDFIQAITTKVKLIDQDQTTEIIRKFKYKLNQIGEIPVVE